MVIAGHVKIGNGLGFRLSAVNRRLWREAMDDPHGLSGATLQILMIIQQAQTDVDGWHQISHNELIERTHRHRTTVSRAIRILTERGYMVRDTSVRGWHTMHRYQIIEK